MTTDNNILYTRYFEFKTRSQMENFAEELRWSNFYGFERDQFQNMKEVKLLTKLPPPLIIALQFNDGTSPETMLLFDLTFNPTLKTNTDVNKTYPHIHSISYDLYP